MSKRTKSEDLVSVISLAASGDGHMPSASPDGEAEQSGQQAAPVSRFRARDSEKALTTNATSGPLFTASSPSADLQRSLENRLRARMDGNGSPLYALTWKIWDMPAGPPICALRASARRISDSDCSGWPTPVVKDDNKSVEAHLRMKARMGGGRKKITSLQVMAKTVAGWPTPNTPSGGRSISIEKMDATGRTIDGKKHTASLEHAVKFAAGWPSPTTSTGGPEPEGKTGRKLATIAGWAPPRVATGGNGNPTRANDGKARLEDQVHGTTVALSHAPTEKRGQLNPEFTRWLMGYPDGWTPSVDTEIQSSRSWERHSSEA